MRIVLDGGPFQDTAFTGIPRYLAELLQRFVPNQDHDVSLFMPGFFGHRQKRKQESIDFIRSRWPASALSISWPEIPKDILLRLWKWCSYPPLETWLPETEVFHGVHSFVPPLRKAAGVVTVHDISFLTHPEFHDRRTRFLDDVMRFSLKHCQRVLADSSFTKSEMLRYYAFEADKIHVLPLAPAETFRRRISGREIDDFRSRMNLPKKFVLAVSMLQPRKNLLGVLNAFQLASSRLPSEVKLVFAGAPGRSYQKLRQEVEQRGLMDRAVFAGQQYDDTLVYFYHAASCLVYPSYCEGFGMPVVEAMACGTPVITTNNSSLPEVAGNAAILLDANDAQGCSDAIVNFVTNEELRREYRARGLERSLLYRWDDIVRKTEEIYALAIADRTGKHPKSAMANVK